MAVPLLALGVRVAVAGGGSSLSRMLVAAFRGAAREAADDAEFQRKMGTATAIALTRTALAAKGAVDRHLEQQVDNPGPYTKRAIGIETASRFKLESSVFVKRGQLKYLEPMIRGGTRNQKRFEQRLDGDSGRRVPGALPAAALPLNRFGNVPKPTLLRVLRQARTKGSGVFTAAPGSHLAPGIYQRKGRKVTPLLIFSARAPQYRRQFDFFGVARREIARAWPVEHAKAMRQIFG
jgi:hypothetical protein